MQRLSCLPEARHDCLQGARSEDESLAGRPCGHPPADNVTSKGLRMCTIFIRVTLILLAILLQAKTEAEAATWIKLCGIARKWAENSKRVKMGLMPLSDAANRIVGVRKIIKRSAALIYSASLDLITIGLYFAASDARVTHAADFYQHLCSCQIFRSRRGAKYDSSNGVLHRWQCRMLTDAYDKWVCLLDEKHTKTHLPELFKVSCLNVFGFFTAFFCVLGEMGICECLGARNSRLGVFNAG